MRQRALIPLLIVSLVANAAFLAFLFLSPKSPLRSEASLQGTPEGVPTNEIQVSQPALIRTGIVTKKQDRTLTIDETDFGSTEIAYDEGVIVRSLNANSEFEITDDSKLSEGDVVSITYVSVEGTTYIQTIDILEDK